MYFQKLFVNCNIRTRDNGLKGVHKKDHLLWKAMVGIAKPSPNAKPK